MAEQEKGGGVSQAPGPELQGPSVGVRRSREIVLLQASLNRHLQELGAPKLLAMDGLWGAETNRAFTRVCRILGVAPERKVRTFRIIAGAAESRTDAERKRAATAGAAYERRLRDKFGRETEAEEPDDEDLDEAVAVDPVLVGDDDIDFDEIDDTFDDEVSVLVRFDPETWRTLEALAAEERVPVGTMLASAIQRAAYLQNVARDGGQLLVKRKRRVYRLRQGGR